MENDGGQGTLANIGSYSFFAGAGLTFCGGAAAARNLLHPLPPLYGLLLAAAVFVAVAAVMVTRRGAPLGHALQSALVGAIGLLLVLAAGLSLLNQHLDTAAGQVHAFTVHDVIPSKGRGRLAVRLADGRETTLLDSQECYRGSNGVITLRPGALGVTWVEAATCEASSARSVPPS